MPTQAFARKTRPRLRETGATYFVTWRLAKLQQPLSPTERDTVAEAISRFAGDRYELHAWVVMDDHIHVILAPYPDTTLDRLVHGWRSFAAHAVCANSERRPPIWQRGGHDRIVLADSEMAEKIAYTRRNPWRRWPELREYRWVWPAPEAER